MSKRVARAAMHPGEILREQFMADFGLTMNRLAPDLHVPATRISEIVNQVRGITPDTALRLGRYFSTTPEFWMNLQTAYDLDLAHAAIGNIEADLRPIAAA